MRAKCARSAREVCARSAYEMCARGVRCLPQVGGGVVCPRTSRSNPKAIPPWGGAPLSRPCSKWENDSTTAGAMPRADPRTCRCRAPLWMLGAHVRGGEWVGRWARGCGGGGHGGAGIMARSGSTRRTHTRSHTMGSRHVGDQYTQSLCTAITRRTQYAYASQKKHRTTTAEGQGPLTPLKKNPSLPSCPGHAPNRPARHLHAVQHQVIVLRGDAQQPALPSRGV